MPNEIAMLGSKVQRLASALEKTKAATEGTDLAIRALRAETYSALAWYSLFVLAMAALLASLH